MEDNEWFRRWWASCADVGDMKDLWGFFPASGQRHRINVLIVDGFGRWYTSKAINFKAKPDNVRKG